MGVGGCGVGGGLGVGGGWGGGGGCFSKPYRKLHNEMNILGRYYGGRRLFLP